MLPTTPPPPPPRRTHRALIVWLASFAVMISAQYLDSLLPRSFAHAFLGFVTFCSSLVFIALTIYWFAVAIRWMLRKLFWRVGRRLFLSYVLIGVLPFILMSILLLAVGYMGAGVMAQAALRGERQASLGQMESWSLEYGLTGRKPIDGLKSLEIYDTAEASGAQLPAWLKKASFSGMVGRNDGALLVVSRQMQNADALRTIVFVQPLDASWAAQLAEKSGMQIRTAYDHGAKGMRKGATEGVSDGRRTRRQNHINLSVDDDDGDDLQKLFMRSVGRKIVWGDITALTDWTSGDTSEELQVVTLIAIPVTNLFQFYFGSSGRYFETVVNVILALTIALFIIYLMAALFAAVLIFSITRAVNRIEKGTKAVERGDFSYRIAMKPTNQLGEMAQSFDRMTESLSSLLVTVAEKERLQSEIEIAATIQRNLLPSEGPKFRGVSFSAHFEPTASIGGDYYDVFNLDKTRLAVAIGDVSGHGLSTGIVMAMVKAAMTTLVEEGADERSLFRRLNELVHRSTERRAFMTLGFTIFDLEHSTIRHTNAGHLYPYLLRKNAAPYSIESPSLPLGVRSDIVTQTVELKLEEGDAIVYLSDGIVEAQDANGDPLGFDHLEAILAQQTDRSPSTIRDAILDAVARHAGTRPADDDRTIMVLRFDNFSTVATAP
ncbi:MAG: serine phosphatase [Acidobacteria bacterium]|nr:serine phosphatase [Acidobacteriota bacterium]